MKFWITVCSCVIILAASIWWGETTGDTFNATMGMYGVIIIGSAYFLLFSKSAKLEKLKASRKKVSAPVEEELATMRAKLDQQSKRLEALSREVAELKGNKT